MAFTVEDGTSVVGANSYMTVAQFKEHHADRGVAAAGDGTFTNTEIQAGIVNASDYIDKRFGRRFKGYKRQRTQGLEWPRLDAFDSDGYQIGPLPDELIKATAEYAIIALQLGRNLAPIPGVPFPIVDPSTGETVIAGSGALKRKTEKVGPIEDTTEYDTSGSNKPMTTTGNLSQNIPEYPQADLWLEELLESGRTVSRG